MVQAAWPPRPTPVAMWPRKLGVRVHFLSFSCKKKRRPEKGRFHAFTYFSWTASRRCSTPASIVEVISHQSARKKGLLPAPSGIHRCSHHPRAGRCAASRLKNGSCETMTQIHGSRCRAVRVGHGSLDREATSATSERPPPKKMILPKFPTLSPDRQTSAAQ